MLHRWTRPMQPLTHEGRARPSCSAVLPPLGLSAQQDTPHREDLPLGGRGFHAWLLEKCPPTRCHGRGNGHRQQRRCTAGRLIRLGLLSLPAVRRHSVLARPVDEEERCALPARRPAQVRAGRGVGQGVLVLFRGEPGCFWIDELCRHQYGVMSRGPPLLGSGGWLPPPPSSEGRRMPPSGDGPPAALIARPSV